MTLGNWSVDAALIAALPDSRNLIRKRDIPNPTFRDMARQFAKERLSIDLLEKGINEI